MVGNIFIPLVLGLFTESPAPTYQPATIQTAYFGASGATVSTYFAEVSNDSISLGGDVRNWVRSSRTELATTQGQSALVCCGIGDFIKDLLALQVGVDWGLYDNDGADGVPNSGDDDGFVDALAVMHPNRGAECNGSDDRIWSHKWTLSAASSGRSPYTTSTPSAGGGFIRIDDYFVQGVLDCNGTSLNPIGVFTHETGHAFGLPDLYDTRQLGFTHAGAGYWDLMASGTYGCSGGNAARPCHMGAWSKAMLGWVDVVTLAPDTDHGTLTLPAVEAGGVVYRVDAGDGSDEYFLLETRRDLPSRLFDKNLYNGGGLLVWQIDWGLVLARWPANTVNANVHMGVWLRQADGWEDLGRSGGGRGDPGDPFPGSTGNTLFHARSNPASRSFEGRATGVTVLDIASAGPDAMSFRLLTRFSRVAVDATGTAGAPSGLFTIDGNVVNDPPANFVRSAPFEPRQIVAAAGETLAPGERRPFVQWTDAPAAPRSRTLTTPLVDTTLVAAYAGTQYELAIALNGGVNGVTPGSFTATPPSPDLWFAPSTAVEVTAIPQTGFAFQAWGGALAGQPNPASVAMSAPVQAAADFEVIYSVPDVRVPLVATTLESVQLVVENGSPPFTWTVLTGTVPFGLVFGSNGRITDTALDFGSFPLTVRARDVLGLTGTATVTLDVAAPAISVEELASRFLLSGPLLDSLRATFLDRHGNQNGAYDLGDFRAWVLANPQLPLSAGLPPRAPGVEPRVVKVPVQLARPSGPEEER